MRNSEFIKTNPGEEDYPLFEELPKKLYEEGSQRFVYGSSPEQKFLEACYVLMQEGKPVGRFAFYVNPDLIYKGKEACCFGSYECVDDQLVANELLKKVNYLAKEKGFYYCIGPMEGSTWNNYRFSDHNKFPNFFLEPYHKDYYPDQLKSFGFDEIAQYSSNLVTDLHYDQQALEETESKMKSEGFIIRKFKMDNAKEELHKIARFANAAFAENFLFTPIEEELFVEKYLPLTKYFREDLILIVEGPSGRVQGLIFAIQDFSDPEGETVIIKSLGCKPEVPFRGMGRYLVGKASQIASQQGFSKMIHALMIKGNFSLKISKKYKGKPYKSYTLYGIGVQ